MKSTTDSPETDGKLYLVHIAPPSQALRTIEAFTGLMNAQGATIELMHVGETAPRVHRAADEALVPVTKRTGDVVSTILEAAEEQQADLIAMPTARPPRFSRFRAGQHHGARHAACAVSGARGASRIERFYARTELTYVGAVRFQANFLFIISIL